MFELKLDNAKHWRDCIDAIVSLIDEGLFSISPEGITLKAMDPSGISMVSFTMPKKAFSKYEIEKAVSIGLNLDNLSKILARTRVSAVVTSVEFWRDVEVSIIGITEPGGCTALRRTGTVPR